MLNEPALQERLRAIPDVDAFVAEAVRLGAAQGFAFGEEDLRAAMRSGRQAWHAQWIL